MGRCCEAGETGITGIPRQKDCSSEGGVCCSACIPDTEMSTYNVDCGSKVCCEQCFNVCNDYSGGGNSCPGTKTIIDMCGFTEMCQSVSAKQNRWYLLRGAIGENVTITYAVTTTCGPLKIFNTSVCSDINEQMGVGKGNWLAQVSNGTYVYENFPGSALIKVHNQYNERTCPFFLSIKPQTLYKYCSFCPAI